MHHCTILWATLLGIAQLVHCQCPTAQGYYCDYLGTNYNENCGVDPDDGSDLAIPVTICPCAPGELLTLGIAFTGTDGSRTTASSSTVLGPSSQLTSFSYDFADANTAIASGSPVTLDFALSYGAYAPASFIYSPVSSIFFTDTTSTITSTTGTATTTTTMATATAISTIVQSTSTIPCTTGTSTVTASTRTISTTSTITPRPKTKKPLQLVLSTTHASCLPSPKQKSNLRERKVRDLAPRQVNVGTFEAPYCPDLYGPPSSTTYTTSTAVVTATVTTTDTSTEIDTSTTTSTLSPTPLTTTVCSNVLATTTTTPSVTSTAYTTAKQQTVTSTQTYTFVYTIYPKHPKPCTPPPLPTLPTLPSRTNCLKPTHK